MVEQGVAASAGAWYSPSRFDLGTFGVSVTPRPGFSLAKAETALIAKIGELLKDGVTETEVARAKKALVAGAIYAQDSLSAAPNVIGGALATGRTVEEVETWPDRIKAVTRAEVTAAARKVLVTARSVTSVLLPRKARGG